MTNISNEHVTLLVEKYADVHVLAQKSEHIRTLMANLEIRITRGAETVTSALWIAYLSGLTVGMEADCRPEDFR